MVHQSQGLPLGFEASNDLAGIHPRLENFQRHFAANRFLLLSHEDDAETAFTDLF